MSNGITCGTLEEANEYVKALREQGYEGKISLDRRTNIYKVRIVAPQQKQQKIILETPREGSRGIVRATRMLGRGLRDIGQSLGTPSTSKRPRIAQLPSSRKEIGIAQQPNLEFLKTPGLRGKTISGR